MMNKEKQKNSVKKRKIETTHSNRPRKTKNQTASPRPPVKKRTINQKKKKRPSNPPLKKHKLFFFIWNCLFYGLMLSLMIGSGLMAMMQQQDKALNGYRMFGVLTNSMVSPDNTLKKGGFRAGDILIIKEIPADQVKVGDVITYHPSTNPTNKSTNYLTHRVAKIEDHLGEEKGIFFITRGDANKSDDMPISARALVGKAIFHIPKVGGILTFIKENWVVSLIFIISIIGFVWVMRIYILSGPEKSHSQKKGKKRKAQPKIDITLSKVNINNTHNRRKHK